MKNKFFFFLQSILRYLPFQLGILLRRIVYRPFFKNLGNNVRIFDSVVIKYPDDISLGDNVTINQFCYIVGKDGLSIGDNAMIGAGTKIATSTHNFENIDTPMLKQGLSFNRIIIEDDVWTGFNAVILGGAVIRKGTIVAANSVVNSKEFEEYSILGGVPAKLLRTRN